MAQKHRTFSHAGWHADECYHGIPTSHCLVSWWGEICRCIECWLNLHDLDPAEPCAGNLAGHHGHIPEEAFSILA